MLRTRKHYQHGLQRENRTVRRPRNITDSARKRLKRARNIILMHNTIYIKLKLSYRYKSLLYTKKHILDHGDWQLPTVYLKNTQIYLHDIGDRQVCRNKQKANKVILTSIVESLFDTIDSYYNFKLIWIIKSWIIIWTAFHFNVLVIILCLNNTTMWPRLKCVSMAWAAFKIVAASLEAV